MHRFRGEYITVKTGWCLLIATMLLMLPFKFVFSWLVAAFIHELSHLLCIKAFDIRIQHISVGVRGILIQTDAMSPRTEAVCAIAGPVGGLFLLLFIRIFPVLSICAAIQTAFNLLPLYPFDGGRVFNSLLGCFKNIRVSCAICKTVEWVTMLAILFFGTIALRFGFGHAPFLYALIIVIRHVILKIPCKDHKQIVQ